MTHYYDPIHRKFLSNPSSYLYFISKQANKLKHLMKNIISVTITINIVKKKPKWFFTILQYKPEKYLINLLIFSFKIRHRWVQKTWKKLSPSVGKWTRFVRTKMIDFQKMMKNYSPLSFSNTVADWYGALGWFLGWNLT